MSPVRTKAINRLACVIIVAVGAFVLYALSLRPVLWIFDTQHAPAGYNSLPSVVRFFYYPLQHMPWPRIYQRYLLAGDHAVHKPYVPTQAERAAWPKTLDEAVSRLTSQMSANDKGYLATRPEEDLIFLHDGWGASIRNEFGLWRGNTELLASCGSSNMHPDSASGVIITATWVKLRQEADPESIRKADAVRATARAIILKAPVFEWAPVSKALALFNTAAAEFHANHAKDPEYARVEVVLSGSLTPDWPIVFENPEAKDTSLYDVIRQIAINHGFEVFYEYPRIRIHREGEEPNKDAR